MMSGRRWGKVAMLSALVSADFAQLERSLLTTKARAREPRTKPDLPTNKRKQVKAARKQRNSK